LSDIQADAGDLRIVIDKDEIDSKSEELGVHVSNVQRDYVFGWVLAGLFQPDNPMSDDLVLKGGNAFRKAYFEHARYSNDLDFSTSVEVEEDELRAALARACEYPGAKSGVEFEIGDTRVDERIIGGEEGLLYEARVYFRSFYGEDDVIIRIDLDVKEFDRIVLPVQKRNLVHSYSDSANCSVPVQVQKLEELLASKLIALLGRQHSPDLYDFVHSVFIQKTLDVSRREVISTFLKKSIYEPTPAVARGLLLDIPFAVLKGFWNEYLVCPKSSTIEFDEAERVFRSSVGELFALLAPPPAFATTAASRGAAPGYFQGTIRNSIMEAARLRRLMLMVYDGYLRQVEPYALAYKRRQDGVGQEYFYAWDRSGGASRSVGIKSFFPDKITNAEITSESFEPRFPIEMAKGDAGYFSTQSFSTGIRRSSRRLTASYGPSYTVQCSVCNKRFRRKKRSSRLNPHKDRFGNRCYGRSGYLT